MSHADDLQAVSVDEALIDVSTTVNQLRSQVRSDDTPYDPAKDFAETIRAQVQQATSCEGNFLICV
jgi:DNA repair protein REV1